MSDQRDYGDENDFAFKDIHPLDWDDLRESLLNGIDELFNNDLYWVNDSQD